MQSFAPMKKRLEVSQRAHLLGHFQAESTFDRLKQKYYWRNMIEDIKRVIAKCLPCIRHQKEPKKEHRAIAIEVNRIFDTAAMNLVFCFPETHSGNKGALAISEYFTKNPFVFPIRSKMAEEIAEKLFIYISIFGPPKVIISDQVKEFLNSVISHLTKVSGVEHRIKSAYHPRTNGMQEKINFTLISS